MFDYTMYETSTGDFIGLRRGSNEKTAEPHLTYVVGHNDPNTRLVDGVVVGHVYPIDLDAIGSDVRIERTRLLAESDYVLVSDAPYSATTLTAYRTYRQLLRDVPAQPGFPTTIIWPTKPAR